MAKNHSKASLLGGMSLVAMLALVATEVAAECRAPTQCIACHAPIGYPPVSVLNAMAPASCEVGDFSRGLNLSMPRFGQRTAKLHDGRVIITGGQFKIWDTTASVDIFNPADGSLTAAASMTVKRSSHTATTLPDGRVLVAGGRTNNVPPAVVLGTAEIYDPVTNTWTSTAGNLNVARRSPTATLLGNGKVLLVGGGDAIATVTAPLASAELFDPATGLFTLVGSMATPRFGHGATLLADGKVLVSGGSDGTGTSQPTLSAELFDPSTNSFTEVGPSNFPHIAQGPARLRDGRVLMAGSFYNPTGSIFGGGIITDETEIFAPGGSFSVATPMVKPRIDIGGQLLLDGTVLVAGGVATNIGPSNLTIFHSSSEVFDPVTNQWKLSGIMSSGRDEFSGVTLDDGRVFVSGGFALSPGPVLLDTVEIYTPGLSQQIKGMLNVIADLPNSAFQGGHGGRTALVAHVNQITAKLGDLPKALDKAQKLVKQIEQKVVNGAAETQLLAINQVLINTLVDKISPNLQPTVAPVATPSAGVEPLPVSFASNAVDPDGTIVSTLWTFGDGTSSTAADPGHTFQCDGTYAVTVQVADDRGAVASGTVNVTVASAGGGVTYGCDVQPVFNRICIACHGNSGGVTLQSCQALQASRNDEDLPVITPGSKVTSKLWEEIDEGEMPPVGGRIPQSDIDKVGQWIDSLDPLDPDYCD